MKIIARRIDAAGFAPFGRCYNMYNARSGVSHTRGEAFEDHMTLDALVDTRVHLGLTVGSAAPCALRSMEKHSHTQEAILCMAEPLILCVAESEGDAPPRAEDVRAFLLQPGDVAVIEREVWHDACHGLGRDVAYYWLAMAGETPAIWEKVVGEAELAWVDACSDQAMISR